MLICHTDEFVLPLPPGHRFPMEKYRLLREAVEAQHLAPGGGLTVPPGATDEELLRAHDHDWVHRVTSGQLTSTEIRRIGFPWSPQLVERSRRSVGGTLQAARHALEDGAGVNLAGGTHHAFARMGEGFCVFNDVAVAIRTLQWEGRIERAAVVDLDVHQGNGTASIFGGDPSVFTTSVHGEGNFPFRKETSDLDIGLPDGTGDLAFLEAVEEVLDALCHPGSPDIVFYLAGADAWAGDRLGRLQVSREALARRDHMVMEATVHAGIPVVVAMAGGYAKPVEGTVAIHLHSFIAAKDAARRWRVRPTGEELPTGSEALVRLRPTRAGSDRPHLPGSDSA